MNWFYKLTSVRPMIDRKYYEIYEGIGLVRFYRDRLGRHWLACNKWGIGGRSRVEPAHHRWQFEAREAGYCFIWEKRERV